MTLTNYWWLLIWLFLVGGVFYLFPVKQYETVMGRKEIRWKKQYAFVLILPYIVWAGFRTNQLGDTYNYRRNFLNAPETFGEIASYMSGIKKDEGFYWLTSVIKCIIGNSDTIYFLIIAAIQLLIIAMVIRKYSCDYWFGIFVFIASADYLSWTYNGIRQFLAVVVVFAATDLILKKKYVALIIVIILASTLHGSALLMLPVVFIIQGKAWNKKTLLCIVASLLALTFVSEFTTLLNFMLEDTQYTNVVSDWQSFNDDGTNPLRVLVYAVPAILSLIGIKWIKREDDPVINMATNASIITAALGIISMGTSGIFLGRLPIYVSMWSNSILLPWEINHFFTKKSAMIVKGIAIGCYFAFFYVQMHYTWGII